MSKTTRGLSPLSAALFIIGEIAGSGVLALPNAMENAGKCKARELTQFSYDLLTRTYTLNVNPNNLM